MVSINSIHGELLLFFSLFCYLLLEHNALIVRLFFFFFQISKAFGAF